MVKILVVRDAEFERMHHYAYQDRQGGGHQNLYRKLLTRVCDLATVEAQFNAVQKDERGLFPNEPPPEPKRLPDGTDY